MYEGDLREPAVLQEFLAKHAETKKPAAGAGADEKKKEAEGKGKGEEKGKAGSKDEKPLGYRVLDGASFKTEVYKDTDAWMVWFKPTAGESAASFFFFFLLLWLFCCLWLSGGFTSTFSMISFGS